MEKDINYRIKKTEVHIEDAVLTFLSENYSSDDVSGRLLHSHGYAEIFYCTHGTLSCTSEGGEYSVAEGGLIIIPKGVRHRKNKQSECFGIGFNVEKAGINGCRRLYERLIPYLEYGEVITVPNAKKAYGYLCGILSEADDAEAVCRAACFARELCLVKLPQKEAARHVSGERESDRLYKLDSIIAGNFTENFTAGDIAEMMYLSERQLARIVREHYGMTLHAVISEKRTDAAVQLLLCTDKSVDEIGFEVGFCSKAGFYREFARRFGTTPAKYRKIHNIK